MIGAHGVREAAALGIVGKTQALRSRNGSNSSAAAQEGATDVSVSNQFCARFIEEKLFLEMVKVLSSAAMVMKDAIVFGVLRGRRTGDNFSMIDNIS